MVLDTCALLFLASGDPRLSAAARERLERETHRWFCAISGFEIAQKVEQGKLVLPLPAAEWLQRLSTRYGLTEIRLDTTLCIAAAQLPPHHRDPCDRFIIAAAQRLAAPVVTVDEKFAAYGVEIVK
jgi:PIN domain nuclease of toxin-antitoxin system